MDPAKIQAMASYVANLKMYPYFDAAGYTVMCLMVRDDNPPSPGSTKFSRKHPLASYISSMLMCFAGSILSNALVGESLVLPFKHHNDVILASAVWYVINYSPFDIAYKFANLLPVNVIIHAMKQIHAVHKIHHGVAYALKNYTGSYVIACLIGVMKGSGYYYMRLFERKARGVSTPSIIQEFLHPSFSTKASLAASIVFILESQSYWAVPHVFVYTAVVSFFVYFTISAELVGIHDPFVVFETIFCGLFLGGAVDYLERLAGRAPTSSVGEGKDEGSEDGGRNKEKKKGD